MRDTLDLLRGAGLSGNLSSTEVNALYVGTISRTLRRRGSKRPAEQIERVLDRMEQNGELRLPPDCRRARPRPDSLPAMEDAIRLWVQGAVAARAWPRTTSTAARQTFKHRWKRLGGAPARLTAVIHNELLGAAMRGQLRPDAADAPQDAVVLFAGTQSATAPLLQAGMSRVHNAELEQHIDMGPDPGVQAHSMKSTAERASPARPDPVGPRSSTSLRRSACT